MAKSFRDAARHLLANNAAAACEQESTMDALVEAMATVFDAELDAREQESTMDALVEAMATVLDAELDARVYTLRLDEGDHVTLVDGDLPGGTPELARDVLNALHERGWHFSRGTA